MANYNRVTLMGNLTRDIELRHTQGGMAIAKFGMAINRKTAPKDGGEAKESTCFVDCTAFGKSADLLNQYVRKGSPLFVDGRLDFSQWEKDGQKRSKLEVIVENFQFMGGPKDGGGGDGGSKGGNTKQGESLEDIPF